MKWVGVALAAVVGALLCETPAGFAILALVIGLTASGLLNKGLSFVGDKLGQAMGSSTWGNIIVQCVAIVLITVATAGAEAGYTAVVASRTASTAVQAATQATIKAVEEGAQEAIQTAASQAAEAAQDAASNATGAVDKTSFTANFKTSLNGYATRAAGVTSLTSTNVIGELVQEAIGHLPMNSSAKQLVETILTAVLTIAVAIASFKGVVNNDTFMNQFTAMTPRLKTGLFALQGLGGLAGDAAGTGNGWTQMQAAGIQKGQGPLQAAMTNYQGMTQVFSSLSTTTEQILKAIIAAYQPVFSINFGAAWQAAAQGLA
jgi:hypothetical protein